jgi:hypothetical protein
MGQLLPEPGAKGDMGMVRASGLHSLVDAAIPVSVVNSFSEKSED